ncbi:hypothetical protein ACIPC2_14645 [Curtobacterium pusillum]|uniref:hypothetical protein n=1 Tax=Curtobacterium pusillum TaxID=69373 RepID=UPI003826CF34
MGEHDDTVRRARRRTTLLAVIGAVVGAVVGWFTGTGQPPAVFILGVIGFAVGLGGLVGAFSLLPTTASLSSQMLATTRGLPRESRQRIVRAVQSGVLLDETADRSLRRRGLDHARAVAAYQPLALAQVLLLLVGVSGLQFPRLLADAGTDGNWSRLICSVALIGAVIVTPVLLRRTRNARRYVSAASRADAGAAVPSTPPPPPHIE